jgi:hypothetical protein
VTRTLVAAPTQVAFGDWPLQLPPETARQGSEETAGLGQKAHDDDMAGLEMAQPAAAVSPQVLAEPQTATLNPQPSTQLPTPNPNHQSSTPKLLNPKPSPSSPLSLVRRSCTQRTSNAYSSRQTRLRSQTGTWGESCGPREEGIKGGSGRLAAALRLQSRSRL